MNTKNQSTINFDRNEPETKKSSMNKRAALFIGALFIAIGTIMFITVSSVLNNGKEKTGPTTQDGIKQEEKLRKKLRDDERKLGEMQDKLVENPSAKRDGFAGRMIKEFERIYDENKEKRDEEFREGGSGLGKNLEKYARFDPDKFPEAGNGNSLIKGGSPDRKENKSMLVIADEGMGKTHAMGNGNNMNPAGESSNRGQRSKTGKSTGVTDVAKQISAGMTGNNPGRGGVSKREKSSIPLGYNSEYPVVTLYEGECLQGVILNEIRSDIQEGPVIVKTTKDFFDESGVYVIIPYGTKVLGRTQAINYRGQKRLYIWFERIILPVRKVGEKQAGIELPTKSIALDQRGISGLVSKVDRHFWLQYGSSLLLGVLDGLTGMAQNNMKGGSFSVMVDGAGHNVGRINDAKYSEYANIMPTVSVKPGSKVKIYMTADINITAYDLKENRPYASSTRGAKND